MEKAQNTTNMIDLEYLNQVCFGKTELLKQMINMFLMQAPNQMEQLSVCVAAKDWPSARPIAHKLKSTVSILGIKSLSEDLEKIEISAAKAEGTEEIPELLERAKATCKTCVDELKVKLETL